MKAPCRFRAEPGPGLWPLPVPSASLSQLSSCGCVGSLGTGGEQAEQGLALQSPSCLSPILAASGEHGAESPTVRLQAPMAPGATHELSQYLSYSFSLQTNQRSSHLTIPVLFHASRVSVHCRPVCLLPLEPGRRENGRTAASPPPPHVHSLIHSPPPAALLKPL